MNKTLAIVIAIFAFILFVIGGMFASRNGAISLEESVKTAQSDIDVMLTNRYNKLNEMAECVKQYDKHEYNTLVNVISERGKNMSGKEVKECFAQFSRVEERYPELQSQKNYHTLMLEISTIENRVGHTKNAYNSFVRDYNQYCRSFPTSFCLSVTGYVVQHFDYYKAEPHVIDTKPINLFAQD